MDITNPAPKNPNRFNVLPTPHNLIIDRLRVAETRIYATNSR